MSAARSRAAAAPLGMDFSAALDLPVPPDRRRLWQPGDPHLYDLSSTCSTPPAR